MLNLDNTDRNSKRDFFEPFYGGSPTNIAQLVVMLNYAKGEGFYGPIAGRQGKFFQSGRSSFLGTSFWWEFPGLQSIAQYEL